MRKIAFAILAFAVSSSALANGVVPPVPTTLGGTGATTASGARANLGAAASGANSDITSLSGPTFTGATTIGPSGSLTVLGALTLGGGGSAAFNVNQSGTGNLNFNLGSATSRFQVQDQAGLPIIVAGDNASGVSPLWFPTAFVAGLYPNPPLTSASPAQAQFTATLSGSDANPYSVWNFTVTGDNTSFASGATAFNVSDFFGGANVNSSRTAANVSIVEQAASSVPLNTFWTAQNIIASAAFSAGGTGVTPSLARGSLYGLNISPYLYSGATNFFEIKSAEFDRTGASGSSVAEAANLVLALASGHAVQGSVYDTLIEMGRDKNASAGALSGMLLGTANNQFPIDNTNGAFIDHQWGSAAVAGVNPELKHFINIPWLACALDCWASPGFVVDGSGQITQGPTKTTWSSTGTTIDAAGQISNGIAVTTGGSGFVNNQIVQILNGVYRATVSGGAITALTPITVATSATTGPTTAQAVNGDGGVGATATLTWVSASAISLNPSGGIVKAGGVLQAGQFTIAGLPTCNASNIGIAYVANGVASPTYNGAVSTTGSTTDLVSCNGTAWTYH